MDVTLLSMPWAIFNRPSIQLAVLQAYLQKHIKDVAVQSLHPYLDVANLVGLDSYRIIAETPWAAEALYCGLLFPERRDKAETVFYDTIPKSCPAQYRELLQQLKLQMKSWLQNQSLEKSKLIGLSVCFSQLPASLYAASCIKKRHPHIPLVFGGSTCTPSLGKSLITLFPFLDYVITGEGEQALTNLVLHIQKQQPLTQRNILSRHSGNRVPEKKCIPEEIINLKELPLPEYKDYFQQLKLLGLDFIPVLPLEFSRGCWWNKCTFCNLNLQWKGYRYKKSKQVLDELGTMLHLYKSLDFTFTDNALPVKEADQFFKATADSCLDFNFFGEIRTLKDPATYHRFRKGGLRSVQIGIESLSDSLLIRMQKGTTVMDNLAAMKFSLQAGMTLDGNIIVEFPGSTDKDVEDTIRALDFALPFRPLTAAGFFLGQGSPVCNNPKEYGITHIMPHPLNRRLYPQKILSGMNMLIKSYRGDRTRQQKLWKPVRRKIEKWKVFHKARGPLAPPALSYRCGNNFIIIRQELPNRPPLHHRLHGLSRDIYLACQEPVTKKALLHKFNQVTEEQLFAFLNDLWKKNILYSNATSCLALAVHAPCV